MQATCSNYPNPESRLCFTGTLKFLFDGQRLRAEMTPAEVRFTNNPASTSVLR